MFSSRKSAAPAAAGGYTIAKSLRFRSSASAYLNRTPASAGNRKTWTWSGWVKLGTLGVQNNLFAAYIGSGTVDNQFFCLYFDSSNSLRAGGYATNYLITTQVFRDPSAWYHILCVVDTTSSTADNRVRFYLNGTEITSFSTRNNPTQNTDLGINQAAQHQIGQNGGFGSYLDGYMAEVNFIDGQALTPTSFGSTNAATGVWQPIAYTGTYGTNGYYLKFTDTTSTSTLGNDSSGNSNTWTVNNISLTAGSTYDSMKDVPTLTDADTANYAVLNPLSVLGGASTSNANLTGTTNTTNGAAIYGTMQIPSSGKWYWELTPTSDGSQGFVGIENQVFSTGASATYQVAYYAANGEKYVNGTNSAYGATWNNNDVIAVAVDADSGTVTFYKNNTSQGAITYSVADKNMFASFRDGGSSTSMVFNVNFGQRPFAYTPPSGFKALNTFNLPTPTIGATASTQANKYFDVTLYTANNSTQTIVNAGGFKPDFVWEKSRANAYSHQLFDSVRGVGKYLFSDQTAAEGTDATSLTSFNSNGYSVGATDNANLTNGTTSVGWQWRASNTTAVTNTSGSITSTVSANTTAGFSIVKYIGAGTTSTVGHGLGVAPAFIILKDTSSGAYNWICYHQSIGATGYVHLNLTAATQTSSSGGWNDTAPTSTVFTLGSGNANANTNGNNNIAYCFAEVAGYSKFGSYTGNGSSDGVFVYLGFRPRWFLVKQTDAVNSWFLFDSARDPYNASQNWLAPNLNNAESVTLIGDFVSNGMKIRSSNAAWNGSGNTYIYAAFAENPFKYSLAR